MHLWRRETNSDLKGASYSNSSMLDSSTWHLIWSTVISRVECLDLHTNCVQIITSKWERWIDTESGGFQNCTAQLTASEILIIIIINLFLPSSLRLKICECYRTYIRHDEYLHLPASRIGMGSNTSRIIIYANFSAFYKYAYQLHV